jgi:opacity protein-like surface antigen
MPVTRIGFFVVFVTVVTPALAAAQLDQFNIPPGPRRLDISGSGGFLLSTDWSDLVLLGSVSPVGGALEQILVRDLLVDPGPVYDATVTYWEGRYGFRARGGFAQSCLAVGRRCSDLRVGEASSSVNVDTWIYDVGGAVGLLDYRPNAWAWPYVFLGVGGITYNLDQGVSPPLAFIERQRTVDGRTVIVRDSSDQLLISIDELGVETQFALHLGFGTDFRIPLGPASLGVRLEVSDHVHNSPLHIQVVNVEQFVGADTRLNFGLVHNLRVAAGVVVQLGR